MARSRRVAIEKVLFSEELFHSPASVVNQKTLALTLRVPLRP